jgi:hypothetical protein
VLAQPGRKLSRPFEILVNDFDVRTLFGAPVLDDDDEQQREYGEAEEDGEAQQAPSESDGGVVTAREGDVPVGEA